MEEAFFLENEGMNIFAILHKPRDLKQKKGIIFCHPFGEEKQFSHRVFVKFARELCDKNYYVLRFDCRGYGDSQGNFEDTTLETQVSDTIKAIEFLKVQLGLDKVDLLGLRMGGTIAAMAAGRNSSVEKLILWFPIISGQGYFDELLRIKRLSELTNNMTSLSKKEILEELQLKGRSDILGYCFTKEMYHQFLEIDKNIPVLNLMGPILITAMKYDQKQCKLFENLSEVYNKNTHNVCNLKFIEDKSFWTLQSLYNCYFPENLYCETMQWILGI
ncbi:MAG: alpha/beta fold hydrolase [Candidatus Brocadiaceae bacterium]|nr:alpha/beta fold hydrolase [Candidatus Brocadiaceae bacterium]